MALSEAIIATYMTIHMARSPGSHSERIAAPCQELQEGAEILRVWLSGNESALVLSDEPTPPCHGALWFKQWGLRDAGRPRGDA
jgi:hypothetical protein